jgi:hypothetical protein
MPTKTITAKLALIPAAAIAFAALATSSADPAPRYHTPKMTYAKATTEGRSLRRRPSAATNRRLAHHQDWRSLCGGAGRLFGTGPHQSRTSGAGTGTYASSF